MFTLLTVGRVRLAAQDCTTEFTCHNTYKRDAVWISRSAPNGKVLARLTRLREVAALFGPSKLSSR